MRIRVNERDYELPEGAGIAQLLEQLELVQQKVAVAVDGEIVPRSAWPTSRLRDGQQVEIVHVVGGGAH